MLIPDQINIRQCMCIYMHESATLQRTKLLLYGAFLVKDIGFKEAQASQSLYYWGEKRLKNVKWLELLSAIQKAGS